MKIFLKRIIDTSVTGILECCTIFFVWQVPLLTFIPKETAAVLLWSLWLPGFLESSIADPSMGSSDGEGTEHCMFRGSTHIKRGAFLYRRFKFFCLRKIFYLRCVTIRIRF